MKKIFLIILIMLPIIFLTGCGAKKVTVKGNRINETVTVPDVENMSITDAYRVIEESGLYVDRVVSEENDEVGKDNAIRTIPASGRKVPKGTGVILYKRASDSN